MPLEIRVKSGLVDGWSFLSLIPRFPGNDSPTRAALSMVICNAYRTGLYRGLAPCRSAAVWTTTQPSGPLG